jgi:hypothetical protein
MKLDTKLYERVFEAVQPLLRSGRPGDYAHIKSVYGMLVALCEKGDYEVNPRVLITAGILHDCGFGFIKKRYMRFFTGQEKVPAMKEVANGLTLAYVPFLLPSFGYAPQEIEAILDIIRHSDEEILTVKRPSLELQILHDLNLFDRFLPHRLRALKALYPDPKKADVLLSRSLEHMILPEFRGRAMVLMEKHQESGKNMSRI